MMGRGRQPSIQPLTVLRVADMTQRGLTMAAIADRICSSRNAVSGLVHRLRGMLKDPLQRRHMDAVAEWMAEHGGTPVECAAALDVDFRTVARLWAAILIGLGWQAR